MEGPVVRHRGQLSAARRASWALLVGALLAFGLSLPTVSIAEAKPKAGKAKPAGSKKKKRRRRWCPKDMVNIREAQIIQEQTDRLRILVVRRNEYSDADEQQLRRELTTRLGDRMDIRIEYVPSIPRAKNGKFRAVISKIDSKQMPETSKIQAFTATGNVAQIAENHST